MAVKRFTNPESPGIISFPFIVKSAFNLLVKIDQHICTELWEVTFLSSIVENGPADPIKF